ncbi:UDP-3-O-glucosamine N-acyltransferase [Punctularia strigosozonata HHB-11173 SS5]|uniref:UDP-3-O-glucosamine N-acyltransferase n=1 Tax=Punctularia strigosozonata (strain HHB-11173) TaxID=741275 RepID=UPI0004416D7B|nr:UDP-3-O-glucosamine N-acyltransferase [Punctularia strigosozonata HHB-11173 SS5]EIN11299.1 UDP-3-O-glucosamine N-acyltransferase [Punctularia strigosozonata HHB-11173 SS5]
MDFAVSQSIHVVPELLAVVLAGFGNELIPLTSPLTSDHGDEPCPKALLPIANKPMLEYPLAWLEQSGIKDVLLICPAVHKEPISHYVHSSSSFPSLSIDLQTFDETQDLSVGTCTVLRHFANRIKRDFVLLPCDLIPPPNLPLSTLLDKFRTETVSDGAIATACFIEAPKPDKNSLIDEWGMPAQRVPIVYDETTGTLLHIDTPDDSDRNAEEIELRMSLLSKYPRTRLSSVFQDSHVYVCKRTILDALEQKSDLDSIRDEFIPWLCKPQYQRTRRQKYGQVLAPITNSTSQETALRHSTLHLQSPTSGADSVDTEDSEEKPTSSASLRVGVVVHRARDGFTGRANNLHSYLELNRHFLTQTTYSLPSDPENRALIDPKANISSDSMVGQSTRVEERASIKRSIIGPHCVIGKMAKVVGCVLLDHCVIADGAKLEGCILGKSTKVGPKAELVRCVTQAGYEVEAGETYKHERLETSDWAAASEEEGSEDEDDGDETESEAATGTGTQNTTDTEETTESEA